MQLKALFPSVHSFIDKELTNGIKMVYLLVMEFEFDPVKSRINNKKHRIDFIKAQQLWEDKDRIVIPVNMVDEPRYMVIGKIDRKHWSAVITSREKNIRIISARRSREEEIEIYESGEI